MSVRYDFIRVESDKAVFKISLCEVPPESAATRAQSEILVTERFCKKLYKDACQNMDNHVPNGPSFESKADLERALNAIEANKRARHARN